MVSKRVITKVGLDRETDLDLKKWAEEAERSKTRHTSVLLRKLVGLRRTNPEALRELQLN